MDSDFHDRLARISHAAPPPQTDATATEGRAILRGMAWDGLRLVMGFLIGGLVMLGVQSGMYHAQASDGHLGEMIWITRDFFGEIWIGLILSPTVAHLMTLRDWPQLVAAVAGALLATMGDTLLAAPLPGLWELLFPPALLPEGAEIRTGHWYPGGALEGGMITAR